MGNHLALFDLIRKRSDNKAEIETALTILQGALVSLTMISMTLLTLIVAWLSTNRNEALRNARMARGLNPFSGQPA
jgi:hypothetical protein